MDTEDDPLHTFVIECGELLEQMEEALLRIELAPDDPETINAIFRAAHTIKGSAGLFGFDHLVGFTHVTEGVLERVRSAELRINSQMVALLLAVCDHVGILVGQAAEGRALPDETRCASEALIDQLRAHLGLGLSAVPAAAPEEPAAPPDAGPADWHLSLRFGADVFRNGLDPLAFIRYLTTFGEITYIATLADAVPPLPSLDPETCHLGFEIDFRTDADYATIEAAFEFVRDDARISIVPAAQWIAAAEPPIAAAAPVPAVRAAAEPPRAKGGDGASIRVAAEKLDRHINLIGELIIAAAGTSAISVSAGAPALTEAAARLARLVEEVRDSALGLRMVQIGATFNRFQRIVRDVSADLGKDIRLEISGAETELDKTVVEKIGDPLTHLVRNSIDHGIESADMRRARGKPDWGTIRLHAYHDAGSIVIEVADDGGGLDRERILAKAVERGLVKPEQPPGERDIDNLIFEPGFSTAAAVSKLSGRGVGMDVVRQNIVALRGSVEIESAAGVGTTMRIRLPLTLAIIDGFLVAVGDASFVVPLDMVVECVELSHAETKAAHGRDHLNLRGEVLPFIRLEQLFAIPQAPLAPQAGSADAAERAFLLHQLRRENVVVVQYAGRRAGLVVDALLGEFQTVIRPLGLVFGGIRGLGGFTILGSGQVALILDVPGLVQLVTESEQKSTLRPAA